MSQITTHVLDTTRGMPASNLTIILFQANGNKWDRLAKGQTDTDGRIETLLAPERRLTDGDYRLHFETGRYFAEKNEAVFYPYVDIVFRLDSHRLHYHIPLLLTAYSYSTYRGS